MQKTPLVTVITATYNLIENGRTEYIKQNIKSVSSQTYPNIEHIIMDGNSTDGTVDLLMKLQKEYKISYISSPDKGVYDAMNNGVKKANGKYISFLNSDDFYHNSKAIELSVKALEDSNRDFSYADTVGLDSVSNKKLHIWRGDIDLLPFGIHFCHQSCLITTELFNKLGGYDLSYKMSADSDLIIRAFNHDAKFIHVPEDIVTYRNGGLSNNRPFESRRDHSRSFFENIGKYEGLTNDDCYDMWNFSLFREKELMYSKKFIEKLKRPEWKLAYYRYFVDFLHGELDEQKRIVHSIENSRSWRLTYPLRKLMNR